MGLVATHLMQRMWHLGKEEGHVSATAATKRHYTVVPFLYMGIERVTD